MSCKLAEQKAQGDPKPRIEFGIYFRLWCKRGLGRLSHTLQRPLIRPLLPFQFSARLAGMGRKRTKPRGTILRRSTPSFIDGLNCRNSTVVFCYSRS